MVIFYICVIHFTYIEILIDTLLVKVGDTDGKYG